MRRLRDETTLRRILLLCSSEDFSKPFTDDTFELALQDAICRREHIITELEEDIKYLRRTVKMLVNTHFEFSKDKRAFITRIYAKAGPHLKTGGDGLHSWFVGEQRRLLETYLDSKSKRSNDDDLSSPAAYLERVRQSCLQRKPWLPRPVFDSKLLDAAMTDVEVKEFSRASM